MTTANAGSAIRCHLTFVLILTLFLTACNNGGSSNSTSNGATTHTVSATAGANGSISPASTTVNDGDTTSFTLTPDTGYQIDTVSGCNGTLSGDTYTTSAITADCSVSASFVMPAAVTHTVSANAGTGGSISPASTTVNDGATASFTVTPNTGFSIGSVSGCGGTLSGNTYTTGAVTADCTVTATFVINVYTVSATADTGGSISPSSTSVNYGGTTSFTITPDTGSSIGSVSGCGGTLSGNTYTTGAVTADCSINVSFVGIGGSTDGNFVSITDEDTPVTIDLNALVGQSADSYVLSTTPTSDFGSGAAGTLYQLGTGGEPGAPIAVGDTIVGGKLVYVPFENTAATGPDFLTINPSFEVSVCADPDCLSPQTATVSLTVNAVDDPPVVWGDTWPVVSDRYDTDYGIVDGLWPTSDQTDVVAGTKTCIANCLYSDGVTNPDGAGKLIYLGGNDVEQDDLSVVIKSITCPDMDLTVAATGATLAVGDTFPGQTPGALAPLVAFEPKPAVYDAPFTSLTDGQSQCAFTYAVRETASGLESGEKSVQLLAVQPIGAISSKMIADSNDCFVANDGTGVFDCSGCAALPGGLDPRTRCGMSQSTYDALLSNTGGSTFETISDCQNYGYVDPCHWMGNINMCPLLSSGTNYCTALDGQHLTGPGTWTQTHTQDVTIEHQIGFENQPIYFYVGATGGQVADNYLYNQNMRVRYEIFDCSGLHGKLYAPTEIQLNDDYLTNTGTVLPGNLYHLSVDALFDTTPIDCDEVRNPPPIPEPFGYPYSYDYTDNGDGTYTAIPTVYRIVPRHHVTGDPLLTFGGAFDYQVYNNGVYHGFWLKFVPDPGWVGFNAEKVVVIANPDFRNRNLDQSIAQVFPENLVAQMWEVNISVLPLNDAPTISDDQGADLSNQTVSVTIPATQGWTPALAMGDPDLSAETPGQVAVSYTLTDGNGNPVDALATTGAIPDLHSAPGSLSFEGTITDVNTYAQAVAFVPPAAGSYSLVVTVDDQGGGGSCLLADPTSLWEIAEFRFDDPSTLESPCHKSVSTTFSITAQ